MTKKKIALPSLFSSKTSDDILSIFNSGDHRSRVGQVSAHVLRNMHKELVAVTLHIAVQRVDISSSKCSGYLLVRGVKKSIFILFFRSSPNRNLESAKCARRDVSLSVFNKKTEVTGITGLPDCIRRLAASTPTTLSSPDLSCRQRQRLEVRARVDF